VNFRRLQQLTKKKKVNFEAFAQVWNCTADRKERFYVTFEVLSAYTKSWEKANNVRVSQELMLGQLQEVKKTAEIFLATRKPFLSYLTSESIQIQPSRGVIVIEELAVPSSLSTELSHSCPALHLTLPNASIHIDANLGCFVKTSLSMPTLIALTDTSNSQAHVLPAQRENLNPVTQVAIQAPPLQESRNPS
jgi:hypothetical protein